MKHVSRKGEELSRYYSSYGSADGVSDSNNSKSQKARSLNLFCANISILVAKISIWKANCGEWRRWQQRYNGKYNDNNSNNGDDDSMNTDIHHYIHTFTCYCNHKNSTIQLHGYLYVNTYNSANKINP